MTFMQLSSLYGRLSESFLLGVKRVRKLVKAAADHRYGATLFAVLTAAAITGGACVLFMRAFDAVLSHRLDSRSIGLWCWLTTPAVFLLSVQLIRRLAPCADGSGIPQAIFAAKHMTASNETRLFPLTSIATMLVKVLAVLLGLWVGASTGREGPTVHVAACAYMSILLLFKRVTGVSFDLRSAVIAGGAAGLAAAFNTPLAGVTFAIEELSGDYFTNIKDYVLMAIIVAAIAAKALTGEYTYFGRLADPPSLTLFTVLLIGLAGGLFGAFFSTALVEGRRWVVSLGNGPSSYVAPVVLSWGVLALAALAGPNVLGPGNQAAQELVRGAGGPWVAYFPFAKLGSTLMTYWSGIAGGIFAPSLSIGSALGAGIGYLTQSPVSSCALIGMAAFLSGAIQAPITAFVIIFEMTGHHEMLLPVMLVSLLSFMTARVLGARHLYHALSDQYKYLLD